MALLAIALGAALATRWSSLGAAPRYNVLLISLDTVRQDALGIYGRRPKLAPDKPTSPKLDRFALQGVRMLDGYSTTSWTLPAHLSLLTGEGPLMHGVENEVGALDAQTPTMAEILKRQGYATYGVYSAPYLEPHWGFARGFERYEPIYEALASATSERAAALRAQGELAAAAGDWPTYDDLRRQLAGVHEELNRASETVVTSAKVSAAVISEIGKRSRQERPWFVFAHYFDAHCQYAPPPPYDRMFDPDYDGAFRDVGCLSGPAVALPDPDHPGGLIRKISDRDLNHAIALYEGEVAYVDSQVGRVLEFLDQSDLARRTLVIIVSDHGEEFFEHGGVGHRQTLNEEVLRIPMLLRLPDVLPAGAAVPGVVSLADVLPTVLDLLGISQTAAPASSSFVPLIRGKVDAKSRSVLARLVMMFPGSVELDQGAPISLRQVVVTDMFRQDSTKVLRSRSWPQFPNRLGAQTAMMLQPEAAAQYKREELKWIDLARFPDEPASRYVTDFSDPARQRLLATFQTSYEALVNHRHHNLAPLPENVRLQLENLGYKPTTAEPAFAEPDFVLPPPGRASN